MPTARFLLLALAAIGSCTPGSTRQNVASPAPVSVPRPPQVSGSYVAADSECVAGAFAGKLWSFGAGAGVAGEPFATEDARILLGTTEGYVHALQASGEYLWSYTLPAAVRGSVWVDGASGRCVVGTLAGNLESITRGGTRAWNTHVPTGISGSIVAGPRGYLYFADNEQGLYAFARNGVAIWRVPFSAPILAGPVLFGGEIALGLERELVLMAPDRKLRPIALSHTPELILPVEDKWLLVLGKGSLTALDRSGRTWSRSGVSALAVQGGNIVIEHASSLVWLNQEGEERARVALGATRVEKMAVDSRGDVAIATTTGEIHRVSPGGKMATVTQLCARRVRFLSLGTALPARGAPPSQGPLLVGDDQNFLHAFAWAVGAAGIW